MKKNLRYFMTLLLMMVASVGWAEDVTDVLTRATTGITGTSYTNWTGKKATSDAVYAGNSAGGNESIQLRSKNSNSGVVTTTSGGKLKKIVVAWNSNTANGRTLNVYGKNTAYSAATDLYDESNQGTLLGTIVYGTSTELTVNGDYQYVGLRSKSDPMYLDEVKITWESSSTETPTVAKPTFSPAAGEVESGTQVTIVTPEGASGVMYSFDGETYQKYTSTIEITEKTTIYAKAYDEEGNYSDVVSAAYTIKQDTPTPDYETVTIPYQVDFTKTQGDFKIEDKTLPEGLNYVWSQSSSYGMKASAYVSNTNYASESWLVSPIVDLSENTGKANLTFEHAVNFFSSIEKAKEEATVWVREEGGSWSQLSINYPESLSWTFVQGGTVDLSSYNGKKIQVGFKYVSTTEKAGTWEIKNFNIIAGDVIEKQEAGLSYDVENFTATKDEENEFPVLNNPHNLEGITYRVTNEDYATIDATTGEITLVAPGQTTVYAEFEGNDEYKEGSASYLLIVKEKEVAGTDKFELVKDEKTLADGDVIILVGTNEDASYALSTTQNSNNRAANEVKIDEDGTITPGSSIQQITLEEEEGFYFNVGDGYLYAASSGSNWLRTEATANDNAKATISIAENGDATIVFQGLNTRNHLRFNPNNDNPIFSCYASTATKVTAVKIYKKQAAATESVKIKTADSGYTTLVSGKALDIVNLPEGLTAYYVAEGGVSTDKDKVTLTQVTAAVPAETPLIFKGAVSKPYEIQIATGETTKLEGNQLAGSSTDPTTFQNDGDAYILSGGEFHPTLAGTFPAGKAYLNVSAAKAKAMTISFAETNGINNVNVENNSNDKVFNLAGQQMKSAVKGVYIKNGRKYVK